MSVAVAEKGNFLETHLYCIHKHKYRHVGSIRPLKNKLYSDES
ncbi:MAG: hypothetical protein BWZ11_00643 [Bacteroidetes bacterium ADurb.BinA395]|nr:MAG: hypothetical protein BWZ11_00643 [Bacteroidetes bacterium ADurb.BinA395]